MAWHLRAQGHQLALRGSLLAAPFNRERKWTQRECAALFCSPRCRSSAQRSLGLRITLFSPRSLPRSEPLPFSAPQAQGPGADGLGRIGAMTDQERRHLAQADRHIAECKEV